MRTALSMRRVKTSRNSTPAAFAACGRSEVGVSPGIVFVSRNTGVPSGGRMKSLRDIAESPSRRWIRSARSCRPRATVGLTSAGTISSATPGVYLF